MAKIRISLTIDRDILERVDSMVDNIRTRSRSQAIENLLRENLNRERAVVILCGGSNFVIDGTNIVRPLAKIDEDNTIVEYIIKKCMKYNFNKFYIVGPKNNLDKLYPIVNRINGIEVRYVNEKTPMGSAKALLNLRREIRSTFLVIPSDIVFDFDLDDMLNFHKKNKSLVTLALDILKKPKRKHYRLGKVTMKGNKVVNYVNESKETEIQVISTFIFYAEPEIFNLIGKKFKSLQEDMFPTLAGEDNLSGYPFHGFWFNIHTKDDLKDARKEMKAKK